MFDGQSASSNDTISRLMDAFHLTITHDVVVFIVVFVVALFICILKFCRV